jgi:hypothetical protein
VSQEKIFVTPFSMFENSSSHLLESQTDSRKLFKALISYILIQTGRVWRRLHTGSTPSDHWQTVTSPFWMRKKIFLDISMEMCFNVSPLLVVEKLRFGTLSSMSGG